MYMFIQQSTPSKKNRGFIALTIAVWATLVLTTIMALESQQLFVYIDEQFYKSELAELENTTNRCLEYAYLIHVSGRDELFTWNNGKNTCFAKTGDKLEATTTNSRFWFSKVKNFI